MELSNIINNNFNLSSKIDNTKKIDDKINDFKKVIANEQDKLVKKASKDIDPFNKKLMEVSYEFEALLVNSMFKVMRKTIHKEDSLLYGGQAEDIFSDMLYDKYSLSLAKREGFGLAKTIYNQLVDNAKVDDSKDTNSNVDKQ